jgi:hypothetical protein
MDEHAKPVMDEPGRIASGGYWSQHDFASVETLSLFAAHLGLYTAAKDLLE